MPNATMPNYKVACDKILILIKNYIFVPNLVENIF